MFGLAHYAPTGSIGMSLYTVRCELDTRARASVRSALRAAVERPNPRRGEIRAASTRAARADLHDD